MHRYLNMLLEDFTEFREFVEAEAEEMQEINRLFPSYSIVDAATQHGDIDKAWRAASRATDKAGMSQIHQTAETEETERSRRKSSPVSETEMLRQILDEVMSTHELLKESYRSEFFRNLRTESLKWAEKSRRAREDLSDESDRAFSLRDGRHKARPKGRRQTGSDSEVYHIKRRIRGSRRRNSVGRPRGTTRGFSLRWDRRINDESDSEERFYKNRRGDRGRRVSVKDEPRSNGARYRRRSGGYDDFSSPRKGGDYNLTKRKPSRRWSSKR